LYPKYPQPDDYYVNPYHTTGTTISANTTGAVWYPTDTHVLTPPAYPAGYLPESSPDGPEVAWLKERVESVTRLAR
jgi:hypothetical protein